MSNREKINYFKEKVGIDDDNLAQQYLAFTNGDKNQAVQLFLNEQQSNLSVQERNRRNAQQVQEKIEYDITYRSRYNQEVCLQKDKSSYNDLTKFLKEKFIYISNNFNSFLKELKKHAGLIIVLSRDKIYNLRNNMIQMSNNQLCQDIVANAVIFPVMNDSSVGIEFVQKCPTKNYPLYLFCKYKNEYKMEIMNKIEGQLTLDDVVSNLLDCFPPSDLRQSIFQSINKTIVNLKNSINYGNINNNSINNNSINGNFDNNSINNNNNENNNSVNNSINNSVNNQYVNNNLNDNDNGNSLLSDSKNYFAGDMNELFAMISNLENNVNRQNNSNNNNDNGNNDNGNNENYNNIENGNNNINYEDPRNNNINNNYENINGMENQSQINNSYNYNNEYFNNQSINQSNYYNNNNSINQNNINNPNSIINNNNENRNDIQNSLNQSSNNNNNIKDSIYGLSAGEILAKREREIKDLERQQEEKMRKEEEEKKKKLDEEKENQLKIEKYEKEALLSKQNLPNEPEENNPDVCRIMFRYPNGEKNVERRFLKTDNISILYTYVKSLGREIFMESSSNDFDLFSLFPTKNLESFKNNTLEQEGLFPSSMIQIREK